ncbi:MULTISPECIES: DoxX family protein [Glycomyces]|uniref:DoxX family protein n=2 Tax=Glycomyces TaxID=58113 RepID=A0A9X3PML1_9ACTN|nr:DoxX family protein [Glycomyces lechevalierae]MDA1386343.1 DoxX family protein [Glycomyces lechevalierae]MDR7338858.1 hypothetical protein [Glycomyces lechevalierae]
MAIAHVIVTIAAALWVGFSAYSLLTKAAFVIEPLQHYGVPQSWWAPLGLLKAAGAVGLLVGLVIPWIGVAAAVGVILYFSGAVVTVLRARSYATVAYPVLYLVPTAAALVLGVLA